MMKRILVLPALMVSILALSGCDAGSSNLDDPIQGPASSCTGDKCTSGIFSPVVKDLEYKCANITALTSANGFFSCPVDETVSFLISHPESDFTIQLGNFVMKKTFDGAIDERYFVTPRNLAGSETSTAISNRELNITALLQALNSLPGTAPGQASYRIALFSADKKAFLNALGRSLDTADFELIPVDFASLVNGALNAAGKPSLMSEADAKILLSTAVNATVAGIYNSSFPLLPIFLSSLPTLDELPAFTGQSGAISFLGHLSIGVDRNGRMFGFGEYLQGVGTAWRTASREYMDLKLLSPNGLTVAPSANALLWPFNGNLNGLSFALENGSSVTISNGLVERGAMAATATQYEEQYKLGTAADSSNKLGTWTSSGSLAGRISLVRSGFIFPVLTPDVWDEISFPLHLTAKIYKSSKVVGEENCTLPTCLLKEVPLTILEDGNIVTDGNATQAANCMAVDPVTLYDGSITESPVGVVKRAFAAASPQSASLEISLLLPTATFSDKRRHVEIGTQLGYDALIQLSDNFSIGNDQDKNSAIWIDYFVDYNSVNYSESNGIVVFSPRCP